MNDRLARQLHDKATRNEPLTAEEETALAAWYAQQDQIEAAVLASSSKPSLALDALRGEVENALMRLQDTAQQVRAQADENEALRRDIAALTQKLAQTKTLQAA